MRHSATVCLLIAIVIPVVGVRHAGAQDAVETVVVTKERVTLNPSSLTDDFKFLQTETQGGATVSAYSLTPVDVPVDVPWRVVSDEATGLDAEVRDALGRFVGQSRSVPGALGTVGGADARAEWAAVQAAVWATTAASLLEDVPDQVVRDRAAQLLAAADVNGSVERHALPIAAVVTLTQKRRILDTALTIELKDDRGHPVPNQAVSLHVDDGLPLMRVTDQSGRARVVVGLPSAERTYTATWNVRLPRATFLSARSSNAEFLAITADGVPVRSVSANVTVAPFSGAYRGIFISAVDHVLALFKAGLAQTAVILFAGALLVIGLWAGAPVLVEALKGGHVAAVRLVSGLAFGTVIALVVGAYYIQDLDPPVRPQQPADAQMPPVQAGIQNVSATSAREQGGCYAPESVLDTSSSSAWVSRAASGTQERFVVELDDDYWVTAVHLLNGVQGDEGRWRRNGAVERLEIVDQGWYSTLDNLANEYGRSVEAPVGPLLTRRLSLRIDGFSNGFNSGGISELSVWGVRASDADMEELRAYHDGRESEPPFFSGDMEIEHCVS